MQSTMICTKQRIVKKIIELTEVYGIFQNMRGLSGKVHVTNVGEFMFIYTTPFSGAEILPGVRHYIVDAWFSNKKVFSCDYKHLSDIDDVKIISRDWVTKLMQLS